MRQRITASRAGGQVLVAHLVGDFSRKRSAAKLLTRDEAGRIAANIATLPSPLQQ